jgi:hypothetical protein
LYLYVVSNGARPKVNGAAIVVAAHAYTVDLRAARQPIPKSVPLQQLATLGYLKPEQIAAFRGLEATLSLTGDERNPKTELMRVHMPDNTDIVLLNDGTAMQVYRER